MSLQSEQTPIFGSMANALIEATPETWSSATLELIRATEGSHLVLRHIISNAERPKDIVQPTDDLLKATNDLVLLSERHKDSWKRCLFRVYQQGESWRFQADFER
jgi:hypothetical protein